MDLAILIGTCAAAASTGSFVPQAWKIVRTRRTVDISTGMYVLTVVGFGLWIAYGVMLEVWPLVVANMICAALSAFILLMKLLPRKQKALVADAIYPNR